MWRKSEEMWRKSEKNGESLKKCGESLKKCGESLKKQEKKCDKCMKIFAICQGNYSEMLMWRYSRFQSFSTPHYILEIQAV